MKTKQVKEIMATTVATLKRNDTLQLARDIIQQKRIRHFPVIDEYTGQVVGVLSQRDLFHATLGSVMKYGEAAERAYLASVKVKEVMTEPAICIGPDADVKQAVELMLTHKVGCLPVVDRGKLLGIVTETDVLKLIANSWPES